ncbi:DUF1996 domain-containing protein [Streptomyces sp. NPDC003023]|uniref:DUF1996 domain-containing protein n=1 Tax=Streptomyces sp. NPDC003023 TaxID=3364675 RepID=UPI0036CE41E8
MGRTSRKRSTLANRAIAASAALLLGGGGLVAANFYASAHEGWGGDGERSRPRTQSAGQPVSTIDCPEVVNSIKDIPDDQRYAVDRELATLDNQITTYYQRFADNRERVQNDRGFAQNQLLNPLKNERLVIIQRIVALIDRSAARPQGLEETAPCTLRGDDNDQNNDGGQNGDGQNDGQDGGQDDGRNNDGGQDQGQGQDGGDQGDGNGGNGNNGGQAGNGPVADDFVEIESVQPNVDRPRKRRGASRGTFTTNCGVNENGLFNSDNVIAAPGVSNGAHHMHDYVGNQANNAFAADDDLANGDTTCNNQGDKSTYYWPVLRVQNGQNEFDAGADGGGNDQNVGEIQTPTEVTLRFEGNPRSKVTAMPKFLRIITGDAKSFTNGDANANASWSCTGFEDRQLKDKYPICPEGSQVVRSFKFQSCWDGQNTDSANHRTHVSFAEEDGSCPNGFRAIPQLVQRIVYDVPPPVFEGDNASTFAVDSFPEQLHKPITDHGDFINVFDDNLMDRMVDCINDGRRCQ